MVSLDPPEATFVSVLLAAIVTFFAGNGLGLPTTESAYAVMIVAAVVAYVAHSLGVPAPTSNAGAPSNVAGPPAA